MNLVLLTVQLVMEISVFFALLDPNIMKEAVKVHVQLCTTAMLVCASHVRFMEIVSIVLVLLVHFVMTDLR